MVPGLVGVYCGICGLSRDGEDAIDNASALTDRTHDWVCGTTQCDRFVLLPILLVAKCDADDVGKIVCRAILCDIFALLKEANVLDA